jgi:hypothetical protein
MKTKRHNFMWIFFFTFIWLLCTSPAFCQDRATLPCEVMESSDVLKSSMPKLNGIRYILLHQANAADRETLSKWLTDHSGAEVTFAFKGEQQKGILCRLANCFGRGLLIYTGDVRPIKKDIIDVTLPLSP